MNVQLRKGGKVHYGGTGDTPACNPWKGSAGYRVVTADINCTKCLTYVAKNVANAADTSKETAPVAETPVRRAKLNINTVHVSRNGRGELTLIATDALRGPVEIHMNESDSRWLRACIWDMGPLMDAEE